MIPSFDSNGYLPPGIHKVDWDELEKRFNGSPTVCSIPKILLDFAASRAAQKKRFRGELFPASYVAEPESGALVLDFFQRDRDGVPKGIVQIDLEDLA